MIEDPKQFDKMLNLPLEERLRLARLLMDSARRHDQSTSRETSGNPLLALAGLYSGGPGNTAERVEEVLESEVDTLGGLSTR